MFRTSLVVLLLLALAVPTAAGPEGGGEPWSGILPDPDPRPDAEFFACRVLDARTRAPVKGARWIRTPEWIAPWRVHHDAVLGVAETDGDGIAWLETTPLWTADCHWLVVAKGYGAAHDYGKVPEAEVLLEPEGHLVGRVLDALGRPVPDALVEVLGGCSHGTAAARGVADDIGRFSIDGVDPDLGGQIWVEGRGIAADLLALDEPRSFGRGWGVVLAMEPGARYTGRVVDLLGAPVEGAVIRAHNEQRGPATRADAAGRFVLEGAEPGEALFVYPPADLTEDDTRSYVDDVWPDFDATIVVSPLGVVVEDATACVRVRAEDGEGARVGGLAFRLVRVDTGRGPSDWTAEEAGEGVEPGEAVERVPPGRWRVLPSDPFSASTFSPAEVEVDAGETASVYLVTRPQSRLQIEGEMPEHADVALRLAGDSAMVFADDPAWLPPDVEAAVRVRVEGRPPFFYPVGPDEGGVRTARVRRPPEPRVVVLPEGARDVALRDGAREAWAFPSGDPQRLLTYASGPLRLLFTASDGTRRETEVVVPVDAGARVVVDASASHVVVDSTRVRALDADGKVVDEKEETPGEWVSFERDGWRTLHGRAPASGTLDVAWGRCSLRVEVRDADGPVDALILVGDQVRAAPAGVLSLSGLGAGPLRIVVGRRDEVGGGLAFSLVLTEGETRTLDVELPLE